MDALICNNCGARLEVAPTTRFVTCANCDTVLEIKRTDSTRYTDVMGPAAQPAAVAEQAAPPARKSKPSRGMLDQADIALEEELNTIDREWHIERDRYLMMSEFGGRKIPSKRRGVIAGIVLVGIAIGLFFMFQSLQPGLSRELGPYISGIVLLFGVGLGWLQYSKGLDYERAHAAYLARRNGVIARYKR
jgi:hypothetical protein